MSVNSSVTVPPGRSLRGRPQAATTRVYDHRVDPNSFRFEENCSMSARHPAAPGRRGVAIAAALASAVLPVANFVALVTYASTAFWVTLALWSVAAAGGLVAAIAWRRDRLVGSSPHGERRGRRLYPGLADT